MEVLASSLVSEARFLTGASSNSTAISASRSSAKVWSSSSSLAFSHNAVRGRPISSSAAESVRRSLASRERRLPGVCSASADGAVALEVTGDAIEKVEEEVPIEKRYPAFPAVLDINAIRDILPHRFPFLLVDRVIEYNPGVSAVAIKNVTINDNFFPGHFPERPIMPGVLMVEAMAQVGGIVMLQPDIGGSKESFFFAGVDKVRFRKPVIAGDTLVMRMNLIKLQKRFGIAKMEGKAYVGGEVVCEGEFLMALGSAE